MENPKIRFAWSEQGVKPPEIASFSVMPPEKETVSDPWRGALVKVVLGLGKEPCELVLELGPVGIIKAAYLTKPLQAEVEIRSLPGVLTDWVSSAAMYACGPRQAPVPPWALKQPQ